MNKPKTKNPRAHAPHTHTSAGIKTREMGEFIEAHWGNLKLLAEESHLSKPHVLRLINGKVANPGVVTMRNLRSGFASAKRIARASAIKRVKQYGARELAR